MHIAQIQLKSPADFSRIAALCSPIRPTLLLVFGSRIHVQSPALLDAMRDAAPEALLLGCSTAGEIGPDGVDEGSCHLTAVQFDKTALVSAATDLASMDDSFQAGVRIGEQLKVPDLRAILVFGPGLEINGSALVRGMASVVGSSVPITGGLAGDGTNFQQTVTVDRHGASNRRVVAVGLCGDALRFGHGSFGGWEPFGPSRRVSRCEGNVLYELDGEPALAVYKRYLGDHARDLPASGLLFPFAMQGNQNGANGLIRTILGVDEQQGSLTLAGEMAVGGYVKLMHASTDKLVNGAEHAAEAALAMLADDRAMLALLISCVGRKLVMGERVDEEVEAVADILGQSVALAGFYSYGEISPFAPGDDCLLHNQTMTITCIGEC